MNKLTIKEIEEKLKFIDRRDHPLLEELYGDDRKGVQQLLNKWQNHYEKKQRAEEKFYQMTAYEREARGEGFQLIAGVDEVGRGPLAGPVVAAAVILPPSFTLLGLDDSKKLTAEKREHFYHYILENAISVGIGIIEAKEIDEINILEATKKAMLSSIRNLEHGPDCLLIDALKLDTPYAERAIIKGDSKSISIAAASVVAKVTRDRMMQEIDKNYPEYLFSKNMGYGTKEHLQALDKYGATPYHRKSFAPVSSIIKGIEKERPMNAV
ncbi:ribonuclease HII [Bacillus dakarensis]|uniref:ribonuclease HII n=1 Tax=Robertmurraya dakarensis TaxID=1926278 RepID=UPI000981124F|nr:ribonuclease HII [Bacillus dakarensis]